MRRLASVWDETPNFNFLPQYSQVQVEAICRASELAIVGITPGSWPRELLTTLQVLATHGYDLDDVNDILHHIKLIPNEHTLPPYVWAFILSNPAVGKTRLQITKERLGRTGLNPTKRIMILNELLDMSTNDLSIVRSFGGGKARGDKQKKSKRQKQLDEEFVVEPDEDDDELVQVDEPKEQSPTDLVMMAQYNQNQTALILKIMGQLGVEQTKLLEWHTFTDARLGPKIEEYSVTDLIGGDSKQVSGAVHAITDKSNIVEVSRKQVLDKSLILESLSAMINQKRDDLESTAPSEESGE